MPCGSVGSPGPTGVDMTERLCQVIVRAVAASAVCGVFLLAGCGLAQSRSTESPSAQQGTSANPDPVPDKLTTNCTITDPRLDELSGLAASQLHPGILWTHNDSGDSARVFAVDATTCKVRAVVALQGVNSWDAEAIAVGRDPDGKPVIWFADIGDNTATRKSVELYRFDEPAKLISQTVPVVKATFTYSDGAHNAESLLVSPAPGGAMWVISKRQSVDSSIYALPAGFGWKSFSGVARPIAKSAFMPTDASFAPDGRHFVVRTYLGATQFAGDPPGSDPQAVDIGFEGQGEGITYSFDSAFLYAVSEGEDPPLLKLPLP